MIVRGMRFGDGLGANEYRVLMMDCRWGLALINIVSRGVHEHMFSKGCVLSYYERNPGPVYNVLRRNEWGSGNGRGGLGEEVDR